MDNSSGNGAGGIAIGRISIIVVLVLIVVAAVIYGVRQFNSSEDATATDTVVTAPVPVALPAPQALDTLAPATPPDGYTVVVNSYFSRDAADRRAAKLTANGNQVQVISRDSSSHLVTLHVTSAAADTTQMLDSLRRFFNPKGVYILR